MLMNHSFACFILAQAAAVVTSVGNTLIGGESSKIVFVGFKLS